MPEGDFLTEYVDGGTLWYKKETNLLEPNDVFASSEEDFFGIWKLHRVKKNEYWLSLRMIKAAGTDADGLITISREGADLQLDFGKNPIYWNGMPRYSDGRVYFNNAVFTMTDTDELYLSSDGTNYYFRRIRPEEGWFCKTCGNLANGNYCYNCGQAYQAQEEKNVTGELQENDVNELDHETLFRGEYVIGSDLDPGIYIIDVNTMDYDAMWEKNKATIRVYDFNDASQKWVESETETGYKKGQRIKISLKEGQKLKVTAGSFDVSVYQADAVIAEDAKDNSHAPWGNMLYRGEYVVGTDILSCSDATAQNPFSSSSLSSWKAATVPAIFAISSSDSSRWIRSTMVPRFRASMKTVFPLFFLFLLINHSVTGIVTL